MYIHKETITLTASTAAGASAYSTVFSGLVYGIRFVNTSLSTKRTVTIARESSGNSILKVAWPSSDVTRFPRHPVHGSTGDELSSTEFRAMYPISQERIKCCVDACSSAGNNGQVEIILAGN